MPTKKLLVEKSLTPIYQRIIEALAAALTELGHELVIIDPRSFSSPLELLRFVDRGAFDLALIANSSSAMASFKVDGHLLFEQLPGRLAFLHHDNLVNARQSPEQIFERLLAYRNAAERSVHFCIEPYNVTDLRALGCQAHQVSHASEFEVATLEAAPQHDVSFLGHLLPPESDMFRAQAKLGPLLQSDYSGRMARLDHQIEPTARSFADQAVGNAAETMDWLAAKYFYLSAIHTYSQHWRGGFIALLDDELSIDIIGGDPAYIRGGNRQLQVQRASLRYHPACHDPEAVRRVYAGSKINLNITSLQFDSAVINRVVDIGAAGGFVLTDHTSELQGLTSVHREISYGSAAELDDKIHYYLAHDQEREQIARQLQQDVANRFTYKHIAQQLLDRI